MENKTENINTEVSGNPEEEATAIQEKRKKSRKKARVRQILKVAGIVLAVSLILAAAGFVARRMILDSSVPVGQGRAQEKTAEQPQQESEPQILIMTDPVPVEAPETAVEGALEEEQEEMPPEETDGDSQEEDGNEKALTPIPLTTGCAQVTEDTKELDLQLYSEHAVCIDLETNSVLAEKNADARIYPASMTKIMTALVAAEHIEDWDATFEMQQSIIDPLFLADATMAGFVHGEQVTMRDLLYGVILPSGAEATEALSIVIAGSEEAFAQLMNEKAEELGLTDTHFVDASGLHDENHYTTLRDLAVILQAALANEMCREVLSSTFYTSEPTEQNPEGVDMINKFLYNISFQELDGAQVIAAKTGYTAQAMNCCASFGITSSGRSIICVTAHAWTGDFCIADHVVFYTENY